MKAGMYTPFERETNALLTERRACLFEDEEEGVDAARFRAPNRKSGKTSTRNASDPKSVSCTGPKKKNIHVFEGRPAHDEK